MNYMSFRALLVAYFIFLVAPYTPLFADTCERFLEKGLLDDLKDFPDQNSERQKYTYELFQRAGVPPAHLQVQKVSRGFHNIFIFKPGKGGRTLVISAHHDVLGVGSKGIIDNAAAIMAIRDLYLELKDKETNHNLVFAIFALEEIGHPAGSEKYVASLTPEQLSKIDAMVALECLAVDGNSTWADASKHLLKIFHQAATAIGAPLKELPAPGPYGPYNDSFPFIQHGVSAISLFGLSSQEVADSILHSADDNMSAFNLSQYQENYELLKKIVTALDLL